MTLTDHFDVDPARAQQDVSDFLGQPADLGLVVSAQNPAGTEVEASPSRP